MAEIQKKGSTDRESRGECKEDAERAGLAAGGCTEDREALMDSDNDERALQVL